MQVRLHKLESQIDILIVLGAVHLLQLYDVLVVELLQEHDLPVGALRVR
jgi:hypothetical protein